MMTKVTLGQIKTIVKKSASEYYYNLSEIQHHCLLSPLDMMKKILNVVGDVLLDDSLTPIVIQEPS